MATYSHQYTDLGANRYEEKISLTENNLFGSSRLGVAYGNEQYSIVTFQDNTLPTKKVFTNKVYATDLINVHDESIGLIGAKTFELSNHLGNVLATVTDYKGFENNQFTPQIASANLYYPFGSVMPGLSITGRYRYGFQGQERDEETGFDNYKYRMHDPRLGRFFAIDPLASKYPHNSVYAFSENVVIHAIELEGLEKLALSGTVPDEQLYKKDANGNRIPGTTHYTKLHISIFKKQADRLKSKYGFNSQQVQNGKDIIDIMISETTTAGAISRVAIFGHAGQFGNARGFFFEYNGGLYTFNAKFYSSNPTTISDITSNVQSGKIKFSPDAVFFLNGRNTVSVGTDKKPINSGFAYELAMELGVTVIGATSSMAMQNPPIADGKFKSAEGWEGYSFYKLERIKVYEKDENGNDIEDKFHYEVKYTELGEKINMDDYVK